MAAMSDALIRIADAMGAEDVNGPEVYAMAAEWEEDGYPADIERWFTEWSGRQA